jgi:hypothetical protein
MVSENPAHMDVRRRQQKQDVSLPVNAPARRISLLLSFNEERK